MARHFRFHATLVGLLALGCATAWPQSDLTALEPLTVRAKAAPVFDTEHASVGGLGVDLLHAPQSLSVFTSDVLDQSAAHSWSQVIQLDASLADNYNTTGYIESLSVRGFVLDQGNNFLRNGLNMSNYVPLALEHLERIEILKGLAGLQAGVSAPGGLVNYVTKKPLALAQTHVSAGVNDEGGSKLHLDSNFRLGALGFRLNAVTEQLHPSLDQANGTRQLAALSIVHEVSANTRYEIDADWQFKRQPSVPGAGLLDVDGVGMGHALPYPVYARGNLNGQPWSMPFEARSQSLQFALEHGLSPDWKARLSLGLQESRINDRIAFPDGCSSAPVYVYPGLCGNGDVDIYDYRSENEARSLNSWALQVSGKASVLGWPAALRWGMGGHTARADLAPLQAYNYVGTSNLFHPQVLPSDGTPTVPNTNTRERSVHGYATVQIDLTSRLQAFGGLRLVRMGRSSERSDGSESVAFEQTVHTPWLGLGWSPTAQVLLYASSGRGTELEAVPNRPAQYLNYGQVLPALESEQNELGLKWQVLPRLLFTAALFDIRKPYADDVPGAGVDDLPQRVAGGKSVRHRGLELGLQGALDARWSVQGSLMALDARYVDAVHTDLRGQSVTNLPRIKGSILADYKAGAAGALTLQAVYEGAKPVFPDRSVELPAAWTLGAGWRCQQRLNGLDVQWRVHVDNLTNRSYWREAPTAPWGGIYLFAASPRSVQAGFAVDF